MKKVVLAFLLVAVLFAGLMPCVQAQNPASSPELTLLYFYSDG